MEVRSVTVPTRPTQEEVDKHCLNHAVYHNWCEFCVRGRGKENPHKAVGERVMQIPVLCMDYGFMREKPKEAGEDSRPILVTKCEKLNTCLQTCWSAKIIHMGSEEWFST